MWLINAHTLKLEYFLNHTETSYAILSHTWGDHEVSFQQWQQIEAGGPLADTLKSKAGYQKVVMTCQLAKRDGYDYVWVDSPCIDKTSSAELSEAINSMFNWYSGSMLCYVYLADLEPNPQEQMPKWENCRWFKRGWTLQELIAPAHVRFYDGSWTDIGTKDQHHESLSNITGIERASLLDFGSLSYMPVPVGKRMSWAAKRQTTRQEDMAYCLLGLFGVNMPLLYGEGSNAFIRLQEEILKTRSDFSLFAWSRRNSESDLCGMLASELSDFADCGDLKTPRQKGPDLREIRSTNLGLRIDVPIPVGQVLSDTYHLDLGCSHATGPHKGRWITLVLEKRGQMWFRHAGSLNFSKQKGKYAGLQSIHIRKSVDFFEDVQMAPGHFIAYLQTRFEGSIELSVSVSKDTVDLQRVESGKWLMFDDPSDCILVIPFKVRMDPMVSQEVDFLLLAGVDGVLPTENPWGCLISRECGVRKKEMVDIAHQSPKSSTWRDEISDLFWLEFSNEGGDLPHDSMPHVVSFSMRDGSCWHALQVRLKVFEKSPYQYEYVLTLERQATRVDAVECP